MGLPDCASSQIDLDLPRSSLTCFIAIMEIAFNGFFFFLHKSKSSYSGNMMHFYYKYKTYCKDSKRKRTINRVLSVYQ